MRSDQRYKREPWHRFLLPVRGRWARYLLCLALVVGVYLAFFSRYWLGLAGARLPFLASGIATNIAMLLAFRSWRVLVDTPPIRAHRHGGRVGAIGAGVIAASVAFILTPASLRGVAVLFAVIAFLLAVPLGALIGGAVWGSRAAAHERKSGISSSDLFY